MVINVKDFTNENMELRSTFEKTQKEIDNFKKSTNFRLSLYQSKEQKMVEQFFGKYLNPANSSDLLVSELDPLKQLVDKLKEENSLLKKQVELNPTAVEKNAKVTELQGRIDSLQKELDP